MKSFGRYLNYCFILIGAGIAFYAESGEDQNTYVLISGIVILMIGIYRISKNIGDKPKGPEGFVRTEQDKDDV